MMKIIYIFIIFIFVNFISYKSNYLKIIYPNGGEKLQKGTIIDIKWETNCFNDRVSLILYKKGRQVKKIAIHVKNTGLYLWKIDENLRNSDFYRIRIRLESNLLINDFSDKNFTINDLPPLPK